MVIKEKFVKLTVSFGVDNNNNKNNNKLKMLKVGVVYIKKNIIENNFSKIINMFVESSIKKEKHQINYRFKTSQRLL